MPRPPRPERIEPDPDGPEPPPGLPIENDWDGVDGVIDPDDEIPPPPPLPSDDDLDRP